MKILTTSSNIWDFISQKLYNLGHGCMNPRFLATWMSKFCTLAPNIFGIIISIFFLYVQKCVSFIAPIRHCQVMVRFTGHSRIVNLQHLVMSPFLYLIFEGECLIFGKLVGPWHTGSDVRRVSVSSAWVWQLKKVENTGLIFPLVCFDVEWLVNDVSRFLSPSTILFRRYVGHDIFIFVGQDAKKKIMSWIVPYWLYQCLSVWYKAFRQCKKELFLFLRCRRRWLLT